MTEYHKINTIFARDDRGNIIESVYSTEEIAYLTNNTWIGTEKVDGTNIRVIYDPSSKTVVFKGKTDNAQIPPVLLTRLQELFPVEKFESFEGEVVCLYGEGYGNRIQKVGKLYLPDSVDFILFDVKIGAWWLNDIDIKDIADKMKIKKCPVVFIGNLTAAVSIAKAGMLPSLVSETPLNMEGLVLRPETQLFDRKGHRIITKIKGKDFKK